jgi:sugar/nucleoside kinase (ribokinase family)
VSDGRLPAAPTARVTVIGCVQADVIVAPVSDLPASGATMLVAQAGVRVGGAGANAALAFVAAGAQVRLMGCVGEDALGRWMREELAPHGLASELAVLPGASTGMTVALESPHRDRTFLTSLGVNAGWVPDMIPADALNCDTLLLCDYFVAPGLQGEAARGLLETAHAHGARTYFDTAWDPANFSDTSRGEVIELLGEVDVFLPNEAEACALAGVPDAQEAAVRLQQASGGWVVVKLGARGCLARGPSGDALAARAPAVVVSDTTGAGDAFNAGLAHALGAGATWPAALQAAVSFASAIVALPTGERYRPSAADQNATQTLR